MVKINYNNPVFTGLSVSSWATDLASSDSRLHKEAVLEKALSSATLGSVNSQCFLFNCYQAYNPFYTFNVKRVPETADLVDQANPWPQFWDLLESLRLRKLTGHAARDSIQALSEQFDSQEWNTVCRRVILRDLRCGISEKTLNKILKKTEWQIPIFTCQLATDSNGRPQDMVGKKRLEQKLDGVRVLAVVTEIGTHLYSRNGKEFENFPQIIEAIDDISARLINSKNSLIGKRGFVLDGEIMGESFQALMKQAQRKTDVQTADMVYNVFDVIPLADFERGFWNAQQHKRIGWLEDNRSVFESTDCVRIMSGLDVDLDTAEGHDVLRRYSRDAVAAGFEGVMVKDVNAPYECRRSVHWLKIKPVHDYDLTVVDIEEGTGKNIGKMGALVCEGIDDGKLIRVNVGSGFDDTQREEYWQNKSAVIGQTAVVLADAVTQNQTGDYSLRFPRFKTFRTDK